MTLEPLMLSDTAMVLLRRRAEQWENIKVYFTVESDSWRAIDNWSNLAGVPGMSHVLQAIEEELLVEMWHLFVHRDLEPVRSLEWHLTLSKTSMWIARKTFLPSDQPQNLNGRVRLTPSPFHAHFMNAMEDDYKKAIARRLYTAPIIAGMES